MWRAQIRRGLQSSGISFRPAVTRSIHEDSGPIEVAKFREIAYHPGQPLVLRDQGTSPAVPLPAFTRWFVRDQATSTNLADHVKESLSGRYLFNYEIIYQTGDASGSTLDHFVVWLDQNTVEATRATSLPPRPVFTRWGWAKTKTFAKKNDSLVSAVDGLANHRHSELFWDRQLVQDLARHVVNACNAAPGPHLFQLNAPARLLIRAMDYNKEHTDARVGELYVAQTPLDCLPKELQDDVPAPELVLKAGKGDIYASSLWLGLQPTYTPWHRDPNPNLFVQLEGSKSVALLPPSRGETLFREVQAAIGASGSSRIRGDEMMKGPQRKAFLDAIWGEGHAEDIEYVHVNARDAVFIPKGWWHSVRSGPEVGELNASANWWFR